MTNKDIINQILEIKKNKLPTKDYKLKIKSFLSDIKSKNDNNLTKSNNLIIKSDKKYNNHSIHNETYYPIFTGFDNNFEDKSFPLRYDHQYSPLFNDENIYKNPNEPLYGNVWVELTGNNCGDDGDFDLADYWAKDAGIFSGDRPAGYVWHHVYMGWFDIYNSNPELFNDGLSTSDILNTENVNFFYSSLPFSYYYKNVGKIEVLDASTWSNCISSNYSYWIPDCWLSLFQLVRKELIFGSEYLDSCDQYIIYSDNVYGEYSGDYTESDHERFK